MIGDPELKVAKAYDMLPEGAGTTSEGRTAADNATVRSVFVIGPDKKIKAMLTYPMSTGRNFDEVLRLLDSCQLTAKHKVATPVNWKHGEDVIIVAGGLRRGRPRRSTPAAGRRRSPTCASSRSRRIEAEALLLRAVVCCLSATVAEFCSQHGEPAAWPWANNEGS